MSTVMTTGQKTAKTILVVDDEKNIRRTLQLVLEGEGYHVLGADSAEMALEILARPNTPVDLAIFDVKLPQMSGLEALERLRKEEATRDLPIIVISGHATVNEAVNAIKLGASDFFEKPLARERVLVSVRNVLETAQARRALAEVSKEQLAKYEMIGKSAPMQRIFHDLEKVAPTRASVLITGESGTGKELIARAVHRLSPRTDSPFVKVNCAAIPRELIESELFGHERGAFTGAQTKRRGFFEQAHGGTLFLDEIGDMDVVAQAKVLRALQSGEISRVGSEHVIHVDVRVLAATNKDLGKEVERGGFREDLFFRLNVFPLRSPNLRERVEDIPLLAHAFMLNFAKENGTKPKPIDNAVLAALVTRKWPGNVRELKNVVERMAILSGDRVTIADLPEDPHESPFGEEDPRDEAAPPVENFEEEHDTASRPPATAPGPEALRSYLTLREYREQTERKYIVDTLKLTGWNISRTAVILGVERTNLHKKIRGYQIKRGEG
ncbi:Response regulator of zinc sigma-54-dependent two-component system [Labilithrix luteola]|uniref:Response regulator of zinc sigma-54-dependent two-component system n=1 Tax=Labilithrix luteola TaxID=1391654 RepID=A0A0K1Q9E4_9BACT|nr:sigma-54 dependent transcriptional regulator [Labilithrix luteola]AKV02353.1 Response regulator of zinc sigma-54-dependent two-component system [Labilithrix luteola]